LFKNQISNYLFRKCIFRDFSSIINKKFKKFFLRRNTESNIFLKIINLYANIAAMENL